MHEQDYIAIDKLAYELSLLHRFITEQHTGNTLVIGNRRYGADFAVAILEDALRKQNIAVSYERVSSHDFASNHIVEPPHGIVDLSNYTKQLIETHPTLIIVDGTPFLEWSDFTAHYKRFPSAMWGYINWAKEFEDNGFRYGVEFWRPDLQWKPGDFTRISIGQTEYLEDLCGDGKMIIACSTGEGAQYSRAYYDDPDIYVKNNYPGVPVGTFVRAVQEETKLRLDRLLPKSI